MSILTKRKERPARSPMSRENLAMAATAKGKKLVVRIFYYLVLCSLSFVFLYPFIKMIVTSLMSDSDLLDVTVNWLPNELRWSNYKIAMDQLAYWRYIQNSLIITVGATVGHVVSCSFIGYGFARYKFKLKGVCFAIVILSMLVPVQTLIFPLYIQYSKMNWLNTFLPLIVPAFFGYGLNGAFFIFLFRQFFIGLPKEMEEAARIDGCGAFRTFFKIMLPMSKSSILVATVLSFVWHWNDYFEPNIYVKEVIKRVLPSRLPGLYALVGAEEAMDMVMEEDGFMFNEAMLMAGTFMVILPVLIVYAFLQKKFMEGVERSGLTGM